METAGNTVIAEDTATAEDMAATDDTAVEADTAELVVAVGGDFRRGRPMVTHSTTPDARAWGRLTPFRLELAGFVGAHSDAAAAWGRSHARLRAGFDGFDGRAGWLGD